MGFGTFLLVSGKKIRPRIVHLSAKGVVKHGSTCNDGSKSIWWCFPEYFHSETEPGLTGASCFPLEYRGYFGRPGADCLNHFHFEDPGQVSDFPNGNTSSKRLLANSMS